MRQIYCFLMLVLTKCMKRSIANRSIFKLATWSWVIFAIIIIVVVAIAIIAVMPISSRKRTFGIFRRVGKAVVIVSASMCFC